MASELGPLIRETATVEGTSQNYALLGAGTGFQGFVAAGKDTKTVSWYAKSGANWEQGKTVVGSSSDIITRPATNGDVIASSNGGNLVNWPAGTTVDIYILRSIGMTLTVWSICSISVLRRGTRFGSTVLRGPS